MARPPRSLIMEDQSYFHVTWKCHNHKFLLKEDVVKQKLYHLLLKYKKEHQIKIYAYCFMSNHPHIVGFCDTLKDFSRFFQRVHSQLAMFINRHYERHGQVVMDRFRSCRIEDEQYLLTALRYVEKNPVRAGICSHPKHYRWSSFNHHALGKEDPLLDPLPLNLTQEDYLNLHELVNELKQKEVPLFSKTYFLGSDFWISEKQKEFHLQHRSRALARGSG